MSGHTPGPWRFSSNFGCRRIKSDKDGTEIACTDGLRDDDVDKANARLIAAAPDTAAENDRLKAEMVRAVVKLGQMVGKVGDLVHKQDSLKAINAELLKRLTELLEIYDAKALEMNSPEIDLGDPEIPPRPWHEEWIFHARAAIAKAKESAS